MNWLKGAAILGLLLTVVGCGKQSSPAPTENNTQSQPSSAQHFTVTDGTKTQIDLTKPAKRFVCLDGSAIEMLANLGETDITFLPDLKTFAAYSYVLGEKAKNITPIGGTWMQPNVEDIVAFKPDLVIGDAYPHVQLRKSLQGTASMYLFSRSGGYKQSLEDLKNLGVLTGHADKSKQISERIGKKIEDYASKSPKNVTSLIIWGTSDTNFQVPTVDDPSASLLSTVSNYPWGGNGAQGMKISLDQILKVNPDVIFVESLSSMDKGSNMAPLSGQLAKNPLWGQLKAVKDHKVYEVDPYIWHVDRGAMGFEKIHDDAMPKMYPGNFPQK